MHGAHGVQEEPGVRVPVAKVAELAAVLDPATQAAQAVALNLKLMRWRAAPALDLDAVAATRCLILGAPQHETPHGTPAPRGSECLVALLHACSGFVLFGLVGLGWSHEGCIARAAPPPTISVHLS